MAAFGIKDSLSSLKQITMDSKSASTTAKDPAQCQSVSADYKPSTISKQIELIMPAFSF